MARVKTLKTSFWLQLQYVLCEEEQILENDANSSVLLEIRYLKKRSICVTITQNIYTKGTD